MIYSYQRNIFFADTDAAGVVYFARLLSICHEAYEQFLQSLNVDLGLFFSNQSMAMPIVHAEIDFFKPLFCGDLIIINLEKKIINSKVFEIFYQIYKEEILVGKAMTRHICINPQTRISQQIPSFIQNEKK